MAKRKPRQCEGVKPDGKRCRRAAKPGELYCTFHNDEAAKAREAAKAKYVSALEQKLTDAAAARSAGVSVRTAIYWREEDHEFAQACADAKNVALDELEASMYERAKGMYRDEDTLELVDGVLTVTKRVRRWHYSDTAAVRIMAAGRASYRTGYDDPPPQIRNESEEELARRLIEDPESYAAVNDVIKRLR